MRYLYQCVSRAVSARETRRAGTVGRALTATSRNGEAVPVNPRRNEEGGRRRWLVVGLLCESLVAALALVLCQLELCYRLGQRGIQGGSQRGIHRDIILCLKGRRWLATKRHADQRLKGLARQSGGEGDAIALAPLCPGQAEAAALIEAITSACKPHAGRLL
jgi:hypothetical protein